MFVAPLTADQESSEFCFCHSTESKLPSFETFKTIFDVPDSLIQDPSFDAVKSRSSRGFVAKPE